MMLRRATSALICLAALSTVALADGSYTVEHVLFLPPTFYVGDLVELRIRIDVDPGTMPAEPSELPQPSWIHIRDVRVIPIADDYGIPDFTDLSSGFSDALRDLERTIRNTIQKYEPRLKSVRVKLIPQEENTLAVSFQIVGQLILEEEKNPITFQSVMDSDGNFTIKA